MKSNVAVLGSGGWFLMFVMSIMFSLVLGILLTYLNIDGNGTAYSIQHILDQTEVAQSHIAKLELERDSLLSPYILGSTAKKLGMNKADPGQIRRIKVSKK